MKALSTFSLKDRLFNQTTVTYLAENFKQAHSYFDKQAFCKELLQELPALELKERITHIARCLHRYLPHDYEEALTCILRALPPELDPQKEDNDFGEFIIAPLSHYVALYGCSKKHLTSSLAALREITKRFSAEDAIRHFLNSFPKETLKFLHQCAYDKNYHVRRLASEGTRPKLPWSQKISISYSTPLSLLDILHKDTTRYVTRSVANHLNDISKIDPDLVLEKLAEWQKVNKQDPKELTYISNHALRTLRKRGNAGALKFLGYKPSCLIKLGEVSLDRSKVSIGEAFLISVTLTAKEEQNLFISYTLEHTSPSRELRTSVRAFTLKNARLKKNETITIQKRHPMKLMTTKRLYPGTHKVTVLANGKPLKTLSFDLLTPQ